MIKIDELDSISSIPQTRCTANTFGNVSERYQAFEKPSTRNVLRSIQRSASLSERKQIHTHLSKYSLFWEASQRILSMHGRKEVHRNRSASRTASHSVRGGQVDVVAACRTLFNKHHDFFCASYCALEAGNELQELLNTISKAYGMNSRAKSGRPIMWAIADYFAFSSFLISAKVPLNYSC